MAQLRYCLELSGHGAVVVQFGMRGHGADELNLELRVHGTTEVQFGTERSWCS